MDIKILKMYKKINGQRIANSVKAGINTKAVKITICEITIKKT